MTITTYTDREIKLQKELALEKQLAQLNGEIAAELKADKIRLEEERDEYQQAADKMAMEHKVERDRWIPMFDALQAESHTLGQQLAEAQALIEASRKQEPVAYLEMKYEGGHEYLAETFEGAFNSFPVFAAPVVADDVKAKYEELIYAVQRKFPNETRHETALRYIKRMEEPATTSTAKAIGGVA